MYPFQILLPPVISQKIFSGHVRWLVILTALSSGILPDVKSQIAAEIIRNTDSVSLVTILNNGNVGIGTSSPLQRLAIEGNETASGEQFQIRSIAGNRTWGLGVGSNGGFTIRDETGLVNPLSIAAGATTGSISIGTNSISLLTGGTASHIKLHTNATERIRVDHIGNVGIGLTTPGEKLDVDGTVRMTGLKLPIGAANNYVLTSDGSGSGTWQPPFLSGTNGTSNYLAKFTGSAVLGNSGIYETASGNVGIGTSSPQQLLVIRGNETASGKQFQITSINGSRTWGIGVGSGGGFSIRDETGALNPVSISAGASTGSLSIGTNFISLLTGGAGSYIRFQTNATERIRLDHSGNLGIGTTSPEERLDVTGTVKMTGFKMADGATENYVLTTDASGNGSWQPSFGHGSNGTANYISKFTGSASLGNSNIYETGDGFIGIGTTSPQQLFVLRGNENASGEQFQITSINGSRTWGIGVSGGGGFTIRDETGSVNPVSISAGAATGSISVGSNSISLLTGGVSSYIKFSTNATECMRLDHVGNLGIGTSSPSNIITVQQSSVTDPIADAWTIYSSRRWKTEIKPLEDALEKVGLLRGVSYRWKSGGKRDIGLIAEEVGVVFPELVEYEANGIDAKSVDYSRLVAILIEAIKDQQGIIDKQQQNIHELSARLDNMERLLSDVSRRSVKF
jgi:hypothetical protein